MKIKSYQEWLDYCKKLSNKVDITDELESETGVIMHILYFEDVIKLNLFYTYRRKYLQNVKYGDGRDKEYINGGTKR